jgi:hypothetical protein
MPFAMGTILPARVGSRKGKPLSRRGLWIVGWRSARSATWHLRAVRAWCGRGRPSASGRPAGPGRYVRHVRMRAEAISGRLRSSEVVRHSPTPRCVAIATFRRTLGIIYPLWLVGGEGPRSARRRRVAPSPRTTPATTTPHGRQLHRPTAPQLHSSTAPQLHSTAARHRYTALARQHPNDSTRTTAHAQARQPRHDTPSHRPAVGCSRKPTRYPAAPAPHRHGDDPERTATTRR